MEYLDSAMEQRVWERVRGGTGEEFRPEALVLREQEAAALCEELSRRFQGGARVTLQQLAREDRRHTACLRGICAASRGKCPGQAKLPVHGQELPEITLRKLLARKLQAAKSYRGEERHPEYGPVMAQLAAEEELHCRRLLEILGQMQA